MPYSDASGYKLCSNYAYCGYAVPDTAVVQSQHEFHRTNASALSHNAPVPADGNV